MKKLFFLPFLLLPLYSFAPAYSHTFDYAGYYENERKIQAKKEYIETVIKTFSYQETRCNPHKIGGSGEFGEFQIMPATWKGFCRIYAKKWIAPTRKAQKEMLYTVISDWVDKGFTLEQIAAKWNSGDHKNWKNKVGVNQFGVQYNVPRYVKEFVKAFNMFMKK